ncbi:unnamed protein product [Protopolystoma xenopodis]|uniref:Uncharacterized protein n=1 Tax=Protopolystoma xenopodis TaxID=117903 RepID=A0A3S5BUB8_9PLAT|nr:unnamed protein product [Protopolystoma xenopodis]
MAKRFYDMAAEASKDAQIPVALALAHLQLYIWLERFHENLQIALLRDF